MAPARRRGGNKAKANGDLSLGDLVLAKIKGFPAWPAKISRPEDWKKTPDPKKYFVQFFGTKEIAFVAPVDIQAFTNEAKSKLSARCQGKTKHFTQAVKEICAAYDELEKQKTSGSRDIIDDSHIGSACPSDNGVVLNVVQASTYGQDVCSSLEQCMQRCGESDSQDEKPSVSGCPIDSSSPVSPPLVKSKSSIGEEQNKHASKSGLKDPSSLKVEVSDCKDAYKVNGNKPRKLGIGSSRSENEENRTRSVRFLKDESSSVCYDLSKSGEALKGGKKGKIALSAISDSPDACKSDSGINCRNTDKNLQVLVDSEEADGKSSLKKNKSHVHGKRMLGSHEFLNATEKLKCVDTKNDKTLKSLPEHVKCASSRSPVVDDRELKKPELKRSTSRLKTENSLPPWAQPSIVGFDDRIHEVLSGSKHESQVQPTMSDSAGLASDENTEMSSQKRKSDANNLKIKQVQRKRRAVCLVDYDDDNEPKTPVHGGAAKNVNSSSFVSVFMKSNDASPENADVAQLANRKSCVLEDDNLKEPSSELHNDTLATELPQTEKADKLIPVDSPHSPAKLNLKQFPSKVEKFSSTTPAKSPLSVPTKSNLKQHKSSKPLLIVSCNATQKKADIGSSKSLNGINSSQNQAATNKKKLTSSVESSKTDPKKLAQAVEVPAATEDFKELGAFHVDRSDVGLEEKSGQYTGSKSPENAKTMKNLIAAAQAKRRLVAQSQCLPPGSNNVQEGTPSPSTVQPFLSISGNFVQADQQGVYEHPASTSPSTNGHRSASENQLDFEENGERRVGSVQRAVGGSLSGGTEAAVARDAFEGMIETLSRTKESIGRATRLAIDCAKYGIANEVVELLIRKLENEASFHRKVDLFFLVDSITQCSHNQKGIAGASYIPTVEEALPRLIIAAAPPGASGRENRRQCLKVLRLWLERKIYPESVLRHYMDDIGVSNDDLTVSFSFRRPSRAERSVDDPIREMEGMLVDEYGSNATFQLPGLLSSHIFDEDDTDDFPSSNSPAEPTHTHAESETSTVTPNDKRHCILEDVDVEMEDVSGHPKEERVVLLNSSSEMDLQPEGSDNVLDPVSNISVEVLDICEGSPPLPPDSPPPLPPLPSSPPPPPPPLSPSPPPPPPPPMMHPPLPAIPTPVPSSLLLPQSSGPAQSSLFSQGLVQPQTSHQSTLQLGCQQSVPHNYSGTTRGNQLVHIAGNSFPGGHNSTVVKNEPLPQAHLSSCFPPMAGCNSQEPSGFNAPRQSEYGQNDMYQNSQVQQPKQQFQLGNAPFAPRNMHLAAPPGPPQNPPNQQYSYPKPTVQHHLPNSFHPPFSLPSLPDRQMQYVANEQWRMPSSEVNTNNQHGLWRGRNPSCPIPPFGQGYFQPPLERPPISNVGFQHANPSNLPAPPMSGHGVSHMRPCRPDIPALNCWRPT